MATQREQGLIRRLSALAAERDFWKQAALVAQKDAHQEKQRVATLIERLNGEEE